MAARDVGARIVLVSAYSASGGRGRFAVQETSPRTMPAGLHEPGAVFHHATVIEDAGQLGPALCEVARGLAWPGGFIAHLAIPAAVQAMPALPFEWDTAPVRQACPMPSPASVAECVAALADGPFAIWVGSGAQRAAAEVRALAERSGAAVFCTPRGKGVFPETHAQFIGASGMGGHESVNVWMAEHRPARVLVLGSRLGEGSSSWDARLVPREGFIHVDVDAAVFGAACPDAPCLSVVADVGALLRAVLAAWPADARPLAWCAVAPEPEPEPEAMNPPAATRVHPRALMAAVQHHVVDASDAVLLAESGNAFAWTTHCLTFNAPRRYRVSTGFGAMGHAAAGVVGIAIASARCTVAVVGDGAMLMQNEINTAVKYGAPAVWIVLNDGRYGMCAEGMQRLGLQADAEFPAVDFAAFARAQGADGVRVANACELDAALSQALEARRPFVVDVLIDPAAAAPSASRNRAISRELRGLRGLRPPVDDDTPAAELSFPTR